jgi:NOL1/NOP2/fmu family ribosome biogenesis protein
MLQDRFFVPHAIANLEDPQAVRFVQGQAIEGTLSQQIESGWATARWRNKPIGWVKGVAGNKESPGRWNNHLPPWARMNSTE